jgi:methionyl-tRNA formyltransferase
MLECQNSLVVIFSLNLKIFLKIFNKMNDEKYRIIYLGFDKDTFHLLENDNSFDVIAVGKLDSFFVYTFNPFNLFLKIVYLLRYKNRFRYLEIMSLFFCKIFGFFSTSVFRKYKNYIEIISKNKIKILDSNDYNKIKEYINFEKIDLVVVNTWDMIPGWIIAEPKHGFINIHPSELPRYRGSLPTLWSLKNNDKYSAVTYFVLDKNVDTGKILSQYRFNISVNDNWLTIEEKIMEIIKKTFLKDLKSYLAGIIKPSKQNDLISSTTGKYEPYKKIIWKDENVDDIYNKINLYPFIIPFDYCYSYLGDRRICIKKADILKNKESIFEKRLGDFEISWLNLLIKSKGGIIKSRLFLDIGFCDSFDILFNNCKLISGKNLFI